MLIVLVVVVACGPQESTQPGGSDAGTQSKLSDPTGFFAGEELREIAEFGPLGEPPSDPTNQYADDPDAAHFGQFLFYETKLSGDGSVSCASCHQPDHGFADPKRRSEGLGKTARHAPTLLNTSYNRWYFWDGRADSTWAQVHSPMEAPNEQGISRLEIAHVLGENVELKNAYETIFGPLPELSETDRFPEQGRPVPDDPDHPEHQAWMSMRQQDRRAVNRVMANVGKAIGAFERKLVSGNAPFDTFMRGLREGDAEKVDALSKSAKRGLRLFVGRADCKIGRAHV